MDKDTLRGELERLFDLDDMMDASRDILGMSPDEVGGTASKAAFARALVERCVAAERVEALLDAVQALKPEVDKKVVQRVLKGLTACEDLQTGSSLGDYAIARKLGAGPAGTAYLAKRDDREVILKVLRPSLVARRSAFARYAVACRLLARIDHEGLPSGLTVDQAEGLNFVAYDHVEGQTMASRTARSGPMHINEARALLHGLLDALVAIHEQQLAHGNVKMSNMLVSRGSEAGKLHVTLIDPAMDRLRVMRAADGSDAFVVVGDGRGVAPEQLQGCAADKRSDVFAFGAVMYEMLTGKPIFSASTGFDFAVSLLSHTPEDAHSAAPRGWVTKDVSEFVMGLMSRDPEKRPKDARAVLEAFETLGRAAAAEKDAAPKISESELSERVDALVVAPEDEAAAAALDEAAELGGDARKVAEAFVMAADQMESTEAEGQEVRKSLLFRAARLYESNLRDLEETEKVYAWIVELDPNDEIADAALEEVRKQLGKHEEVVEMLLARLERSEDSEEKAAAMAEIGRLYASELDDSGQAVVAYAQAFTESPSHGEYADAIERVAGSDMTVLGEAISMMAEATQTDIPLEDKNLIFLRLGQWYAKKVGRSDAALSCYQAVIATDPTNDGALDGMAGVFRSTQKYPELGQVLMRRAEAAFEFDTCAGIQGRGSDLVGGAARGAGEGEGAVRAGSGRGPCAREGVGVAVAHLRQGRQSPRCRPDSGAQG